MRRILLLSRVNTSNLGDQLIGRSMMALFSPYGEVIQGDLFCSQQIIAIKEDRCVSRIGTYLNEPSEKGGGMRDKLRALCLVGFVRDFRWLIKNHTIFKVIFLNKFDIIIIGGGELISPSFASALSLWATLISILQRKAKVVLFGVGVTDAGKRDLRRIGRLVRRSNMVFVRDTASMCKMETLYKKKAIEIPDVAFVNDFHCQGEKRFVLFGLTTIGRLQKHGYLYSSEPEYYDHLISEITGFQDKGFDVRLSYTSQEDYNACSRFMEYFLQYTGVTIEISDIKTLDDLIRMTQSASLVVSPRMHGCILGQLSGSEVRPEVISEKMLSYKNKYLDGFDCQGARKDLINRALSVVEE